jgi:hypothetical protein
MHLSRTTFVNKYEMPITMHITYCGKKVMENEVSSEENVTCNTCIQMMCLEEIDMRNCETHLGG